MLYLSDIKYFNADTKKLLSAKFLIGDTSDSSLGYLSSYEVADMLELGTDIKGIYQVEFSRNSEWIKTTRGKTLYIRLERFGDINKTLQARLLTGIDIAIDKDNNVINVAVQSLSNGQRIDLRGYNYIISEAISGDAPLVEYIDVIFGKSNKIINYPFKSDFIRFNCDVTDLSFYQRMELTKAVLITSVKDSVYSSNHDSFAQEVMSCIGLHGEYFKRYTITLDTLHTQSMLARIDEDTRKILIRLLNERFDFLDTKVFNALNSRFQHNELVSICSTVSSSVALKHFINLDRYMDFVYLKIAERFFGKVDDFTEYCNIAVFTGRLKDLYKAIEIFTDMITHKWVVGDKEFDKYSDALRCAYRGGR